MHIGTLFSLPLSSHRYFVLIYIIDHTEVRLQTYDLDLRFRGHPGRPASPDLAPQGARDRSWGTDSTCACTRIGTCEGSLLSSHVTWLPNGPTWDCFRSPCFLALSVTSLFVFSVSDRFCQRGIDSTESSHAPSWDMSLHMPYQYLLSSVCFCLYEG